MDVQMIKVVQEFDKSYIEDVKSRVESELDRLKPGGMKGKRIAITAGSRGIDRIADILKAVVGKVREYGGEPFLVPAMGSHGGATAEGQVNILEELGITPEYVNAPILSTMEVVEIDTVKLQSVESGQPMDLPVVIDKNAFEADGIIVVNRVKPHTSFHANIESGMMKMIVIGLGKRVQAERIHSLGTKGLKEYIVPVARRVLETGKVIAGIGIVENAYSKVHEIRAFLPDDIETGDRALLEKARNLLPRLPVDKIDVLVVENLGKNISGTGMDTKVIGRLKIHGEPEPEKPSIGRIVVLGLTPETRGNAYGIGLADFTTRKVVDSIDYAATYANAMASTFTERVKIPVIAENEEQAFEMAVKASGVKDPDKVRAVRIKNTLELEEIWVSPCLYDELNNREKQL
jgi:hypothetical protein